MSSPSRGTGPILQDDDQSLPWTAADDNADPQLPPFVDVTPSPRCLQILGHVNIQGWQAGEHPGSLSIDEFRAITQGMP